MTEPQAGSDPQQFTTTAVKDGDEWVINGWKFFSSNARTATFLIVMAITDPDVSIYQGASMFLVPTDTPGVVMERHVGLAGESEDQAMHALIHYDDVRVPAEGLLGGEGQAFAIAQTRLGGGRVHHAMRTVACCQRALDLLCERVLSRETQGSLLARKQFIQGDIADSYAELAQFRLLVLYTAWEIDQTGDYRRTRKNIAAIKALTPKVVHDAVWRSMHAHGALGVSNEMPFGSMWMMAPIMSVVDGPTEVHKVTVAREVLKGYEPSQGLWPTAHLPAKRAEAREKLAAMLEHVVGNS
jgi:acyl-CoA dehydrogenase